MRWKTFGCHTVKSEERRSMLPLYISTGSVQGWFSYWWSLSLLGVLWLLHCASTVVWNEDKIILNWFGLGWDRDGKSVNIVHKFPLEFRKASNHLLQKKENNLRLLLSHYRPKSVGVVKHGAFPSSYHVFPFFMYLFCCCFSSCILVFPKGFGRLLSALRWYCRGIWERSTEKFSIICHQHGSLGSPSMDMGVCWCALQSVLAQGWAGKSIFGTGFLGIVRSQLFVFGMGGGKGTMLTWYPVDCLVYSKHFIMHLNNSSILFIYFITCIIRWRTATKQTKRISDFSSHSSLITITIIKLQTIASKSDWPSEWVKEKNPDYR